MLAGRGVGEDKPAVLAARQLEGSIGGDAAQLAPARQAAHGAPDEAVRSRRDMAHEMPVAAVGQVTLPSAPLTKRSDGSATAGVPRVRTCRYAEAAGESQSEARRRAAPPPIRAKRGSE